MKPVLAAAEYSGISVDDEMVRLLTQYSDWLRDEAVRAGGLGPAEANRLESRHIADSLLFASLLPADLTRVWDLGSGVGLPGIPLAITHPGIEFLLIDRSGRRVDLLRRALRVLDLSNCEVQMADISSVQGPVGAIVTRATLPPNETARVAERLLTVGGVAIMGGSWQERPVHEGWETIEIPAEVLDHSIWLLMMRRE